MSVEITSKCPFLYVYIEKAGQFNRLYDVIVVVGTFLMVHGLPCVIAPVQKPINGVDRYVNGLFYCGYLEETHLVLGKLHTDFIVIGCARPFDDMPTASWPIGVRVGPLFKAARVMGFREWVWGWLRGWQLTPPQPTTSVELHLGMAYGGAVPRKDYKGPPTDNVLDTQAFDSFPDNPAGMGYHPEFFLDRSKSYPAPRIEDIKNPIVNIDKRYPPVAFGPVPRFYPARSRYLGDCDAKWQEKDFPFLPENFDFRLYQSAQPDLIAESYLNGDEPIVLAGCHPQGRFECQLPGINMLAVITDANGHSQPEPMPLDTVAMNIDDYTIQQVWRLVVPKSWQLRHALLAAIPQGPPPTGGQRPITVHRPSGGPFTRR